MHVSGVAVGPCSSCFASTVLAIGSNWSHIHARLTCKSGLSLLHSTWIALSLSLSFSPPPLSLFLSLSLSLSLFLSLSPSSLTLAVSSTETLEDQASIQPLTELQLQQLQKAFLSGQLKDPMQVRELAARTKLPEVTVKVWFTLPRSHNNTV